MSAVSNSRCIATRTAAPAAATGSPACTALGVRPLPRLDGHVEVAGGVGNVGEQREIGGAEEAVRVRLHEEVEGLLPVAPRRGVTGALDEASTRTIAHRTPPLVHRRPGADRNRGGYRGNSLAHASRVGATRPRAPRNRGGAMENAKVNGVELEYEVTGSGEPVLLISPVLADGFLPLLSEPALADRYQLIRYHKRGWAGSTHTPAPVTVADHAADAAALLEHLGMPRAHVAGHSSGAAVAAQLALDQPEPRAHPGPAGALALSVPGGQAFLEQAGPAFEAYAGGDHEGARDFLSAVSGLDWATCRALLDERFPAPSPRRSRTPTPSSASSCPASPSGRSAPSRPPPSASPCCPCSARETQPLWVEIAEFLRSRSRTSRSADRGVGHLLHIQRRSPSLERMAQFLERNPMVGTYVEAVE